MTDLTGKTAVITGSARGLGKAIALRYATLGANVVVNYASSREAADATVAEIESLGAKAIAVQADVSTVSDIERLFAEAVEQFGQVRHRRGQRGRRDDRHPVPGDHRGTVRPALRHQRQGHLLHPPGGSPPRRRQRPDHLRRLEHDRPARPGLRALRLEQARPPLRRAGAGPELADRGVTVNTILPTAIDGAGVFTDADPNHPVRELIASQPGRIGRRMGTVDDVADAAEYLSSDLARWVSGQSLLVSGGALQ